jgi:hypothetical protein
MGWTHLQDREEEMAKAGMKIGREPWPERVAGGKRSRFVPVLDALDKLGMNEHISVTFETKELRARSMMAIRPQINNRWPGASTAEKRFSMASGNKDSKTLWIMRIK